MSALRLYRQMVRASRTYEDYNLRSYTLRRCREGFLANRAVVDQKEIEALLAQGREQLAVMQRQSVISNMYAGEKSVMETL